MPTKRAYLKTALVIFLFLALLVGAFGAVFTTIFLQDVSKNLPSYDQILSYQPSLTTLVYDRKGRELTRLFEENRTWVKLNQISPVMVKAVLAAEDDRFYDHPGIRIDAIVRAALADIMHKKLRQGGSTITQQLARNLFLGRGKTLQRKAREAILSMRIEKLYTKDQILEMYLNTIYLGHGAYGVAAAAQIYYSKTPDALDLAESSMLAGLIAAPEAYTPLRQLEKAKSRQNYVLRRMTELSWITPEQSEAARTEEIEFKRSNLKTQPVEFKNAPYFVTHLLFKQLLPEYGTDLVYRGGLEVHTTLDLDLQRIAEKTIAKMKHEGALVALDPSTGEILALVGGRNFDDSKFNRATQAYRQPGSSFKPIVYATAIENGYRPVDHVLDAPLVFANKWSPGNYDRKFNGEVTIMDALIRSLNTVSVRVAQLVGVASIAQQARDMGISTPYLPEDLSISLGSLSVTPLEMGAAFCAFANNGYKVTPYGIKEIRQNNGELLAQYGPQIASALSVETAVTMRSVLTQAVNLGTGTRAKVEGYDVFGKTGTTNDWTDAWFIGGVPGLVAVVYVGNDNHKTMGSQAQGGRVAAPVWQEFMAQAVKVMNLTGKFTVPREANVQQVRVCRITGFLAASGCKSVEILMNSAQVPESTCPWHGGNLTAALEDPNAPQLLLSPNDDEATQASYAHFVLDSSQEVTSTASADIVPPPVISVKQPTQTQQAPLPSASSNPYRQDPSPADVIEKRYQELLKKYNLGN